MLLTGPCVEVSAVDDGGRLKRAKHLENLFSRGGSTSWVGAGNNTSV